MPKSQSESSISPTLVPLVFIFLLTIILFKYIQWKLSRKNMYKLVNQMHKFPLKSAPFIGISYHFIGDNEHILKTILSLVKIPSPSGTWLGPMLIVYISRPEDLQKVLNNPFAITKSRMYNYMNDFLGDGIFVSTGPKYKKQKKIIISTFNQKILDSFVEIFVKNTNVLLKILETKKGVTDFTDIMTSCALDTVCETVLGIELNTQQADCKFAKYLQRNLDIIATRVFNVWLHPSFIYHLTPMCYEQKKIINYMQNFTKEVLAKKREEMNSKENLDMPFHDEKNTNKNNFFLELFLEMLNNGTLLTEHEIIDEVNTFLLAGVDTSATVVNFVLLMLAIFPEVQQKVYEEVIEVLGTDNDIEYSDLPKMVYLERVIKETMRIFPLIPVVGRTAEEDIKLDKYTIPKGAQIALAIINTHRSSDYFKDPLRFDPDRFLPEEIAKRHPYTYLPFTSGIRKCIGEKFAYMFMKTVLSKLVRKFTFETPYKCIEEIRLKESLTLKAVDGFPIKLKERY